ncbi:MAG TPA: helix-turn-helix domain-containing protein [Solirubrobacteraceae bacterium]|nr:helix-turn-helix domain-containing protein [Solirubrobacteraceae bacterium]
MDRAALKQMLDEGLSLDEIARRSSLHESTVGYWVKKHGLRAVNRDRHVARGALPREALKDLVAQGASTAEIALAIGRSKTTVRHWLREYGLRTQWAARRRSSLEGEGELTLSCERHGLTTFKRRRSGGYRCGRCRAEAVTRRRRKIKRVLVQDAGGACAVCGYRRCIAALEFHHLLPAEKSFSLSHRGVARSIAKARAEASKCVLLCANCHAEVEAGVISLAPDDQASLQSRQDPGTSPG